MEIQFKHTSVCYDININQEVKSPI